MLKINLLFLLLSLLVSIQWSVAATDKNATAVVIEKDTEVLLRMARPELEKIANKLTLEQKLSLKQIAFNSKSDLQIRWRALVLAARLLGIEMKSEIVSASKSNEWFMRSASMMAANEISTEQAAELARKLIQDKALVVRSAAVDILGNTGETADRALLWKIIKDPMNVRKGQSLWIRSQSLQILARNPNKQEIPQFIALLKETDLELQAISIHALEKASDFQFGTAQETIEDHRQRWLKWWDDSSKIKSI